MITLGLALGQLSFLLNFTNFVMEYGRLLRIKRLNALFDEYEIWLEANDEDYGFPVFIREKYSSFWARLFGCPFCFITFDIVLVNFVLRNIDAFSWLFQSFVGCFSFLAIRYIYLLNFPKQ